jgi:methyl-accepting chemotaxis protein
MSFPAETTDGQTVLIETKTEDGDLIAEDGSVYRAVEQLKVELKEAGEAVGKLADEASESLDEVVGEVKEAAEAVAEASGDLVDAAEDAVEQIGDVLEAGGDVVEQATEDPLGTLGDLFGGPNDAEAA